MKTFLTLGFVIFSLISNAQYFTEYVHNCKFQNSDSITNCESLLLSKDFTFMHSKRVSNGLHLITEGNYIIVYDTIKTIDDEIKYLYVIKRRSSFRDVFDIKFKNQNNYPVYVDSLTIFKDGNVFMNSKECNSKEFTQGDSLRYYISGLPYSIPLNFGNHRRYKIIEIELPVRYYKIVNDNKIISLDTKTELMKNVP